MEPDRYLVESDCWNLPVTSLYLKCQRLYSKIPELCATCLPALRTLSLDLWNLESFSFNMPGLTSLRLWRCYLPETVWNHGFRESRDKRCGTSREHERHICCTSRSRESYILFVAGECKGFSHELSSVDQPRDRDRIMIVK